ncbi:LysR family transcriptional regulator [Saxibacter everestensis]|uniref:LysR family transcriptional regulator n=1 Tax=Saxibacter everestensis TaxID=2909229 RepID=A0ABY8QRJ4_9MICO|nr:LysR family transcriptional regulator [Brevibacteriaceae bacterium ZFBP1038]
MRISLERLEAFVASAQTGSFSAAARRLNKTQSTISNAIATLEIDVGTDLFDRSTRAPTLTAAGERLLLEAQTVIDRCIAFENHADSLSVEETTELTISVDVPGRVLLPVFNDFARKYPYVNLTVQSSLNTGISESVLIGSAALGVSFSEPRYDKALEFKQLGKLILIHVAAPGHSLCQQESVSFADLRANRRLAHSAQLDSFPTMEYLRCAQTWQIYGQQPLIEMTKAGLGWATIPRQLILDELAAGELVELQLEAYPHTDWLVGVDLLWSRARKLRAPELWLKNRLLAFKVSELSQRGQATTF